MSGLDLVRDPWPWWVAGPAVGLMVPVLLVGANRALGVSSSLRHLCAAARPGKIEYFRYDWKAETWNLLFVLGIAIGAGVGAKLLANPATVDLSARTVADLAALGVKDQAGLLPRSIFSWEGLVTLPGFVSIVIGGFLVGFGARYADGCTAGHAIFGLSSFQLVSLLAVLGFFAGGLLTTHLLMPLLFGGAA